MDHCKNREKIGGSVSRREFLSGTAAAMALTVVPSYVLGKNAPSNKLNIACIGVGGVGASDVKNVESENIVAMCDVDWHWAAKTLDRFPKATKYWDYRKMLEKERGVDAVVISTPDHAHAPQAIMAMKMGRHVYVQKPMGHTIYECRKMTEIAREMKVVTQMGNGGHAGEGIRLTYEFIHAGAIGTIREVHSWSNRPVWPQGIDRPKDTPKVPDTLDWDLWLGPAPYRPYHPAYVPFKWRGWWDFGCGAMGDMAVHNADPAFFCLGLKAPYAVEAQTGPVNNETLPEWQKIKYYFAARGDMPPVTMTWWDGKKDGKPNMPPRPAGLEKGRKLDTNGIYFVGDKGTILCRGWASPPRIIPESKMKEYQRPPKTLKRSIGHHKEWIQACKDNKPEDALAGFTYSGPFTESLLVGNLAVRLGKRIEWDAKNLKATNAPEADILINKKYRAGFEI
jgi:predicted dehydrogenase